MKIEQTMMFGLAEVEDGRTKRLSSDEKKRFWQLTFQHQGLFTQAVAALLLGVSRQYVNQLISEGKLEAVDILGQRFVSGKGVSARMLDKC